jgi:hypothetical protein
MKAPGTELSFRRLGGGKTMRQGVLNDTGVFYVMVIKADAVTASFNGALLHDSNIYVLILSRPESRHAAHQPPTQYQEISFNDLISDMFQCRQHGT